MARDVEETVRAAGFADLPCDAAAIPDVAGERRHVDHRNDRREIGWAGGHDRFGPVSQNRRRATDTEPAQTESSPPDASAETTTVAAEAAQHLRGLANELPELILGLGGLASAEASLSLTALLRMLGLRAIGVVLVAVAIALVAVAATLLLSQWLGSSSAALGLVAAAALGLAWLSIWRAGVWRARIGFTRTREALGAEPPPREGPRP